MYTYTDVKNKVEDELRKLELPPHPARLYEPVQYMLTLGGKRFRPCLTLMCANLFTEDISAIIRPALALEVFHNFTLMHDDIMDQARLRRGSKTVHEKWDVNTAILSGDVMLVIAYALLGEVDKSHLPEVLEMFSKTAAEVCEGQQLDIEFEKRTTVNEDEYINMICLKTAVLLGCCAYIGAVATGAERKDALHLYNFGKNLGISFQIQDDMLDAFGDAEKFGKKTGGDILQDKKTLLWISLLNKLNPEEKKDFTEKILELHEDEKINYVMQLFEKFNIQQVVGEAMKKYYEAALNDLENVQVTDERKQVLLDLAAAVYLRSF